MIRVEHLTKTFVSHGKEHVAVNDISFENPTGNLLTLLGPSGCGKSTTLRGIAGLESPDSGEITIGERLVFSGGGGTNFPPAKRQIGMVFQSYAIWPHMTVYKNVEYPLKRRGVPAAERRDRVMSSLSLLGLSDMAGRPAPFLSGGQQQRVALARAIVGEPEVLLLDEPLSNLDAKLRRQLATYLRGLQRRLNLTAIYVTHDQEEALVLADTVALMRDGRIVEWGAPREIYAHPRTQFGAQFLGDANVVPGVVHEVADGYQARTDVGLLHFAEARTQPQAGDNVAVVMRPENVNVVADESADHRPNSNVLRGTVRMATFLGELWEFEVQVGEGVVLKAKGQNRKEWGEGDSVVLIIDGRDCVGVAHDPSAVDEAERSMTDEAVVNSGS